MTEKQIRDFIKSFPLFDNYLRKNKILLKYVKAAIRSNKPNGCKKVEEVIDITLWYSDTNEGFRFWATHCDEFRKIFKSVKNEI